MTRSLVRAIAIVAVGLSAAACGPHPQSSIAIRSTGLNLEFARPDLAKPIPPIVVLRLLPAPPPAYPHLPVPTVSTSLPTFPRLPATQCPPASQRAKPAAPLRASTAGAPEPGYYSFTSKGTGTVSGGKQNISAPIPPRTEVAISRAGKAAPDATVAVEGGAPASGTEVEYTVVTHLSDTVAESDQLMVSASSINLVQRTLSDGQRTMSFTPTPQVQLMKFGPVGSTWKSSGTDSNNSAVMNYQGTISAIRQINVCGQLVRAYQVTYSESLANAGIGEIIRTSGNDPNTFTIAPQLGGLVISQHVDTDDIRFNASLSGYIGVTLNYTSTIDRLTPSASASGP